MGKQAIFNFLALICVAFVGVVFLGSNFSPLIFHRGSNSLEVVAKIDLYLQCMAFSLFLTLWAICYILPFTKKKLHSALKIFLTLSSLTAFIMSGHHFRYSGKENAVLDKWFIFSLQKIHIDPNSYIDDGQVKRGNFSIKIYDGDTPLMTVFLGLPPLHLSSEEIIGILEDLGFKVAD